MKGEKKNMATTNVKFFFTNELSKYQNLAVKDPTALYFVEDTETGYTALYKGESLIAVGSAATKTAAGLMSAEDKQHLDTLIESGFTGEISAKDVMFDSDLVLTQNFGRYTTTGGKVTVPAKDKSWYDVFMDAYSQDKNPTITQPSVSLTANAIKAYEVGTKVTPTYTATFNAGSYEYGPETGVTVTAWSVTDGNETKTTASGSFAELTVADDTSYSITATATYGEGAIPKTALDAEYADGKISAGSKSATKGTLTGYRSFFYGVLDTSSVEAPLTSAIVRGLTNGGAYNSSKTFTLNGSATAKRIVIAVPSNSTRTGLKEVILTSAMNTPVTDSYVKTAAGVQVEGANGATAIDYDVWTYEPASIDAGEVHKITLA